MGKRVFRPKPRKDWGKIGIFSLLFFLILIESVRIVQEFDKADMDIITMVLSTLLGYCMKKALTELNKK